MKFEELDLIELKEMKYILNDIRAARIIDDNGFYTNYIVLSTGHIVSMRKNKLKIRKTTISNCGYEMVNLAMCGKANLFTVHRLVALAFIPNPENKTQVNHIDGVKTHNDISNLEWNTPKENMDHSWKHGLRIVKFGDESYNPKITSKQAKKICKLLEENELTLDQIAEKIGTTRVIVYNIKHKLAWTKISDKYLVENHTIRSDGNMRMTKEMVHDICKDLEENILCTGEIAEKYGVSMQSVSEIYQGKTHKDIAALYNVRNHTIRPNVDKKNMHKVKKICELLQDTTLTISEIAKQLDVPEALCYRILNRQSWKHISDIYDFSHRKSN